MDEVKKKMEALRRKVELMKKQKAEKQQQGSGTAPPCEYMTEYPYQIKTHKFLLQNQQWKCRTIFLTINAGNYYYAFATMLQSRDVKVCKYPLAHKYILYSTLQKLLRTPIPSPPAAETHISLFACHNTQHSLHHQFASWKCTILLMSVERVHVMCT